MLLFQCFVIGYSLNFWILSWKNSLCIRKCLKFNYMMILKVWYSQIRMIVFLKNFLKNLSSSIRMARIIMVDFYLIVLYSLIRNLNSFVDQTILSLFKRTVMLIIVVTLYFVLNYKNHQVFFKEFRSFFRSFIMSM